jgi:hypothetical protein
MTSKDVKELYDNGKIEELYKKFIKYFNLIDEWAEKMTSGNILNEYELSLSMEQCNGSQTKLNPISGALEAMLIEYENNYIVEEESKFENLRVQDQNSCKAKARSKVSDLRRYASDFTRYCYSAQQIVTVAQSRLKRLTVEKGNKGVDYTGEVPVNTQKEVGGSGGW